MLRVDALRSNFTRRVMSSSSTTQWLGPTEVTSPSAIPQDHGEVHVLPVAKQTVKRVIGVGGDHVTCQRAPQAWVSVNGVESTGPTSRAGACGGVRITKDLWVMKLFPTPPTRAITGEASLHVCLLGRWYRFRPLTDVPLEYGLAAPDLRIPIMSTAALA